MIKLKTLTLIIFIFSASIVKGQNKLTQTTVQDTSNIIFKDTLFNFVFDSLTNNLGLIPNNENKKLVKCFKYIGKEPIVFSNARGGDPHYICYYPKEVIIPNKIYSFTVCFWHKKRWGNMAKNINIYFSNNTEILIKFKGTYLEIIKQDNQ